MSDHPEHLSHPQPKSSVMNRVVVASLGQKLLVALLTLILVAAGIRALSRLPVDAYPDLSPPLVQITSQWPGHAAEEVERLITVPVERAMNGIPRRTAVRSISLYGLSEVTLTFDNTADNYFARQQATNNLQGLALPNGVSPSLAPLSSPSGLGRRACPAANPTTAAPITNTGTIFFIVSPIVECGGLPPL